MFLFDFILDLVLAVFLGHFSVLLLYAEGVLCLYNLSWKEGGGKLKISQLKIHKGNKFSSSQVEI